jgi:hypothetical protein
MVVVLSSYFLMASRNRCIRMVVVLSGSRNLVNCPLIPHMYLNVWFIHNTSRHTVHCALISPVYIMQSSSHTLRHALIIYGQTVHSVCSKFSWPRACRHHAQHLACLCVSLGSISSMVNMDPSEVFLLLAQP